MTITAEPVTEAPAVLYWTGPLAIEDTPTGDGRRVMPDALSGRDLPLPLLFQSSTPEGTGNPHAGADLAGRITLLWQDGPTWHGAGPIDTGEAGTNMARFLQDGPLGISVDLDDVTSQMECLEEDEYGDCLSGELQLVKGRIMGATATPFPAIPGAQISLATAEEFATLEGQHTTLAATPPTPDAPHAFEDSGDGTCTVCGQPQADHPDMPMGTVISLIAAAARNLPPESWFEDPNFVQVTPFTICDPDEHGNRRCYGHLARWGQPHMANGRTPPRSGSGYAYYRTGATRASCECPDKGGQVEIPTGTVTLGTGHLMDLQAGAADTVRHYDHTGLAVAYVAAGEDEHGIWGAGVIAPDVTEERIVELRAASLSGDWRFIGGRLELVAVLAVNVPGFAIPRTAFHTADGRETALVAAGVVPVTPVGGPEPVSDPDESVVKLAQAIDAVLDEVQEAFDAGNAAQVGDLLVAAEATVDTLLELVGGTDEDDPDSPTIAPAGLASRLGILETRLARQARTIDTLQPLALERLAARFGNS